MVGSFVCRRMDSLFQRIVGRFDQHVKRVVYVIGKVLKFIAGLLICFITYDVFTPIYSDVSITTKARTAQGVPADVVFSKVRNCVPMSGTVVAFAYFDGNYRQPVKVMQDGELLRLKNFPPSEMPTSLQVTWALSEDRPNPNRISMSWYVKCRTRISQHIYWEFPVTTDQLDPR